MTLISKLIVDFVGLGKEIDWNNTKVKPEVNVTIASVYIAKRDEPSTGLLSYSFKADGAKYGLNGYINSSESIVKILDLAQERGEAVCVRLEKKRKKKVDPTIPIKDLTVDMNVARDNITKIVVGVWDPKAEKWLLTREAGSNPANDPEGVDEQIKQLSLDATGFFDAPASGVATPGVQVNTEEQEKESSENTLMSIYFFIKEQELKNSFKLTDEQRKKYAILLLKIANKLQVDHFNLDQPVYSAHSHKRAIELVFKWAASVAPLNNETIADMKTWGVALMKEGALLWDWAELEVSKL